MYFIEVRIKGENPSMILTIMQLSQCKPLLLLLLCLAELSQLIELEGGPRRVAEGPLPLL